MLLAVVVPHREPVDLGRDPTGDPGEDRQAQEGGAARTFAEHDSSA
jgi:hypothetical protein